jgi:hypothetical protein
VAQGFTFHFNSPCRVADGLERIFTAIAKNVKKLAMSQYSVFRLSGAAAD